MKYELFMCEIRLYFFLLFLFLYIIFFIMLVKEYGNYEEEFFEKFVGRLSVY